MLRCDERPQVVERDTGRVITVYATECTCEQFKPMAIVGVSASYVCRQCHSLWCNQLGVSK